MARAADIAKIGAGDVSSNPLRTACCFLYRETSFTLLITDWSPRNGLEGELSKVRATEVN